jgi:carbon starvation protein
MSILFLLLIGIISLLLGYFAYGFFLSRLFRLRNDTRTPAFEFKDDVDFVPTNKVYLLGQHLSAIAAAGPIVGTILAAMWFGWLPTILWIILGGIFIGGVHDMATIVASIRHKGKSIAEVIRENMSNRAFILFLLFLWFSIIFIVTAFTDITAATFIDPERGAGIASSSMMYLGLAVVMGITLRIFKPSLLLSTLLFIPFVFLCIYLGPLFPLRIPNLFGLNMLASWDILLLIYCFFASVVPVWLLLQPRGYLGGFFLSFTALVAFIGLVVGSFTQKLLVQYPAFTKWVNPVGMPLLPLLFTTVACGACSGFHAIVASGTTSKQLSKETDARLVGFGGMLLESFVALIALSTLLILSTAGMERLKDPSQIYANGIAVFLGSLGINKEFALNFALLAFATFVYDTLDVATRLGRYIFQELSGWRGKLSPYIATAMTLLLPAVFVTRKITDVQGNAIPAWKIFWTVFGSSNQLLAAMVLLGLSVWLFRKKMKFMVTLLPAFFMMIVAVISLCFILWPWICRIFSKGIVTVDPLIITGITLLVLALLLIIEAGRILIKGRQN